MPHDAPQPSVPNLLAQRDPELLQRLTAFRGRVHDLLLDQLAGCVLTESATHPERGPHPLEDILASAQVLRVLTKETWDAADLERFDAYWRDALRSDLFGDEFEADKHRLRHAIEAAYQRLVAIERGIMRPERATSWPERKAVLTGSCHWTEAPRRATAGRVGLTHSYRGMKVYHGMRTENGCTVVVEEDGEFTGLAARLDLRNHSPTGLEWGYAGSGPAQLALALAADVLGNDDRALAVYQRLKFQLIGGLDHEGWVLTEGHIRAVIERIEQEQSRSR